MSIAYKRILQPQDDISPERLADEDEFSREAMAFFEAQAQRIAEASTFQEPGPNFWENEQTLLLAFLLPFLLKWAESGVGASVTILNAVQLGVSDRTNALAAGWAERHALNLARGLNSTTRELARARIVANLRAGGGVVDLTRSLRDVISPAWRAEMIAQTEITRALNEASRLVAAEVDAIRRRIWYTRRDERVCPICQPLHGARENRRGMFPGGFDGPPAHPRCRCSISYEV